MEKIKLINIGFGNTVNAGRVVAIINPDSSPIRRLISEAKEEGRLIDATYGRKTRAVIVMDNFSIVLSSSMPETIASRTDSIQKG